MEPSHDTPADTPAATLTLKAAAELVGVSTSTVRRRKQALISAGTEITSAGWAIPLSALEAVFALPTDTPSDTHSDAPTDTPSDTPARDGLVEQLRSENAFLRQQVEQQARTIERQAEAHAVISAQLTQLGQIEAGLSAETVTAPPEPRRRWWHLR